MKEKRKDEFHRENKRFGGKQAKQTEHKHKPNLT